MKEGCRRVLQMQADERRRASTDASAYSLPAWMYDSLATDRHGGKWLEQSGHLLLERPSFLNVAVPPKAVYNGPAKYAQMLRRDKD